MRHTAFAIVGLGLMLSACSSETAEADGEPFSDAPIILTPPPEVAASQMKMYVDSLVNRFDAEACADAEVLEFGGKRREIGHEVNRVYTVDRECLLSVEAEMQSLGFKAEGSNRYVARRDHGWVEQISLNFDEAAETGKIIWAEIIP